MDTPVEEVTVHYHASTGRGTMQDTVTRITVKKGRASVTLEPPRGMMRWAEPPAATVRQWVDAALPAGVRRTGNRQNLGHTRSGWRYLYPTN